MRRLVLAVILVFTGRLMAGQLEDQLRAYWQGAWVVLTTDVYSNCNGFFSNNDILQGRATSKANHAFRSGEMGKIHKIDVKRSRVSVYVLIAEPIMNQRQDGPFTLFNEAECKGELRFKLGRQAIKQGDFNTINAELEKAMLRFENEAEAEASSAYNGREREPFPEDYEETLAAYEAWQIERRNLAMQAKADEALEEMDRILGRLNTGSEYANGFVDGIQAMKRKHFGTCDQLVSAQFYQYDTKPSGRITETYKDGYEDGQHLAFFQEIASRLRKCLE